MNKEETKEDNIEIEVQQANTDVAICCSHSSLYGLKYISRVSLSVIVIVFSFVQVSLHPDKDNSIYFSLISSILGYYLSVIEK